MRDYKHIITDDIPCWYELSWRKSIPAIILRVHQDFVENAKIISNDTLLVKALKEDFKFENFNGNFNENFGFDNVFINRGLKGKFVEFLVKIPKIKFWVYEPCSRCGGLNQLEIFEEECIKCKGRREFKKKSENEFSSDRFEHHYNWKVAHTISASFNVFFRVSGFPKKETSSPLLQLLTVSTITDRDMHGGSLSGKYSKPLVRWLSSFKPGTTIFEMVEAMKVAYRKMFGECSYFRFRASVDHKNGWLNVDCPGNACGLNPSHNSVKDDDNGYEFNCHNVDTVAQQLTLLVGLAALHDKARREIN